MTIEIAFALFGGLFAGFVAACFVCVSASVLSDRDAEKSGVWQIKDRAYLLTKITKQE